MFRYAFAWQILKLKNFEVDLLKIKKRNLAGYCTEVFNYYSFVCALFQKWLLETFVYSSGDIL